jgi:hypothetical protein
MGSGTELSGPYSGSAGSGSGGYALDDSQEVRLESNYILPFKKTFYLKKGNYYFAGPIFFSPAMHSYVYRMSCLPTCLHVIVCACQDDSFNDLSHPAGVTSSSGGGGGSGGGNIDEDAITSEMLARAAQEFFGGAMPSPSDATASSQKSSRSGPCPLKSALWSCTQAFIRTTGKYCCIVEVQ